MKECQYFPPYIWERVKMNKAELMPTRFGLLKHPPAQFLTQARSMREGSSRPQPRQRYC